jgi:hypothetical protein
MSGALALAVLVLAPALALAGCESNIDRSAAIAGQGRHLIADKGKLKIGAPNRDVRVQRAVIVRGDGAAAAAVEVRNAGRRAQVNVPILIDVRDGTGTSVYRNDAVGLQPALQRLAVVRSGRTAWWVNDQLLGADTARSVNARIGNARAIARPPHIEARDLHIDSDSNGPYLTGAIVSRLERPQRNLPVFAVALRGGRVVAAGRALVPKVVAHARKPVHFRLLFVGNPRGARIQVTIAPEV